MNGRPLILLLVLVILPFTDGHARMYKWVDDDGNVQYTQHPPPDREAKELKTRKAPISDEDADLELERLTDKADTARKDREFGEGFAAETKDREARLKKNCETSRENLRVLQQNARVQKTDKDGKTSFLTPEQHKAKVEQTKAQVEDNCG